MRRKKGLIAAAGVSYLLFSLVLWWHAWASGASTHTLCGCGDPALFLWFFQWPATAVAHGHSPFYSTAMFHPGGINLLAQTSVLGMSVPLIPVTWVWGPVASLNVASTLAPALSAFAMYAVLGRWVRWGPAAYIGGLLYGFSPTVLTSLQFAHLMTAAIMLLPLILAALDEILWRQRHSPRSAGLVLGLLLFVQFFLSTELLAVMAVVVVLAVVVLVGAGALFARERLVALAPHAVEGLVVGALVSAVLLAYPVWFALDGPAHLSGLIWANIGAIGGYDGSSFVSANLPHGASVYTALGGYEGKVLPSSGYLGWGLIAVLGAGTVIWFRDRRLWFFGFVLALCAALSLGERKGSWEPVRIFSHIPVVENVIVQRFMVVGFLAAALMLAVILEHGRRDLPRMLRLDGLEGRALGIGAAIGLGAVALVPIATTFAGDLPFAMEAVTLPRWYTAVAPKLPPGRVLLSYPAPFSGIQVTLAWQAVDVMDYSQAGGGGPQGVDTRAGSARPGFVTLVDLAFGVTTPQPDPTPRALASVREAMRDWRVNTVVIAPQQTHVILLTGHDPLYAVAFMTAVLGRTPHIQAGAWVWDDVTVTAHRALKISTKSFDDCVGFFSKERTPSVDVARCTVKESSPS